MQKTLELTGKIKLLTGILVVEMKVFFFTFSNVSLEAKAREEILSLYRISHLDVTTSSSPVW
jgi:hypothetical protein